MGNLGNRKKWQTTRKTEKEGSMPEAPVRHLADEAAEKNENAYVANLAAIERERDFLLKEDKAWREVVSFQDKETKHLRLRIKQLLQVVSAQDEESKTLRLRIEFLQSQNEFLQLQKQELARAKKNEESNG